MIIDGELLRLYGTTDLCGDYPSEWPRGGDAQRRGAPQLSRVARKLIGTVQSVLSFTSVGTIGNLGVFVFVDGRETRGTFLLVGRACGNVDTCV